MTSPTAGTVTPQAPPVPRTTDGVDALASLARDLAALHRLQVRVVAGVAEVLRTGACERIEGLPVDLWLGLQARMIGADRATLVTCAEIADHLPCTWELFVAGEVSFGVFRNLAAKLARSSAADRATVDARLAATYERWDGLDVYGPDRLLEQVDRALDELTERRRLEERERRAEQASYVAVQPSFDGRITGGFDLDPVTGGAFLAALDDAAPDGPTTTLARRRAIGLGRLAAWWTRRLHGRDHDDDAGTQADLRTKVGLLVRVDLSQLTVNTAGELLLTGVPGGVVPTVTARTLEALAGDADVQAVVFDGHRPLTATRKVRARRVPDEVRAAVVARDGVDRMPGSDRPLRHVHHTHHRSRGGDHHVDRLVGLSARSHGIVHTHGWTTHHDPDSGVLTISRAGRRWRSIAQTIPLEPDPGASAESRGPPRVSSL